MRPRKKPCAPDRRHKEVAWRAQGVDCTLQLPCAPRRYRRNPARMNALGYRSQCQGDQVDVCPVRRLFPKQAAFHAISHRPGKAEVPVAATTRTSVRYACAG